MAEEIKTAETTAAEPPKEAPKPEQPKEDPEVVKLKAALSRANSEAAEWKRQLREKQTEQERADAERAEREREREARIAELEAKERISTYKGKLMETGIDAASADIMAKALPEGVGDDYFATMKTFFDTQRKAADAAALNNQPGLSVGLPPSGVQKSELDKELDKIFRL